MIHPYKSILGVAGECLLPDVQLSWLNAHWLIVLVAYATRNRTRFLAMSRKSQNEK